MRPTHHQEGSAGHRSVQHPVPLTEFAHALPPQCRSISLTAQRPRRGSAAHQPAVRTPVSRAVGSGSRDGSRETVHTSRSGRARDGQHYRRVNARRFPAPVHLGGRACGWPVAAIQDWIRDPESYCAPATEDAAVRENAPTPKHPSSRLVIRHIGMCPVGSAPGTSRRPGTRLAGGHPKILQQGRHELTKSP